MKSAFLKLRNLYDTIIPIFDDYGFKPPSAGVIARDLSEKIELSIIQHCQSFDHGVGFDDLQRNGSERWEVKICKGAGLTINQSKRVGGESYIVVNYKDNSVVKRIFVLLNASDQCFSEKKPNSNARTLNKAIAQDHIEVIYTADA